MTHSIQYSCNAYYCNVFRRIVDDPNFANKAQAYSNWRELAMSFGFGQKLQSDFPNELSGNIPSANYYNRIYRNSWNSLTIVSLAIGQGELGVTPLHLANMTAALANKGFLLYSSYCSKN